MTSLQSEGTSSKTPGRVALVSGTFARRSVRRQWRGQATSSGVINSIGLLTVGEIPRPASLLGPTGWHRSSAKRRLLGRHGSSLAVWPRARPYGRQAWGPYLGALLGERGGSALGSWRRIPWVTS